MDGARISYTDQGQGDALVLLHGWIGSGALWGMVAPWLSERFRVIVPDLPGHGDSGIPEGFRFTLDGFAAWLDDLRRALELARVSLVGHSMGGSISMHYAASHPDQVDRLVLIDAPPAPTRWAGRRGCLSSTTWSASSIPSGGRG